MALLFILRYHGVYLGQDVAVKILRSEHLNDALEDEFAQEVAILRLVLFDTALRSITALGFFSDKSCFGFYLLRDIETFTFNVLYIMLEYSVITES